MAPIVPILRPCQSVPSECAASSITGMPRASHSAMIASMSEVWPRMWLMMTAEMSSSSLAAKSADVDAVIVAHLDEHRLAIGVHHRGRHGGEGEGRDQDAGARGQVERAQRQEDRRRAGGDGERVFRAHQVREFPFQQGHGRIFGRGVAEQIAGAQKAVDLGAGGLGDGFGVVDIGCARCAPMVSPF
jgi:hypothetical protein